MVNIKYLYSIKSDYGIEKDLAIVPVKNFNVSSRYKVEETTIYPSGSFDPKELMGMKTDLNFLEIKEDFFNSAIVVFPVEIKKNHPFKNFTVEERQQILNSNISKTEEFLNVFKYIYCNLDKTSLLMQRAGYINNIYSGILIYYPQFESYDFIKDKYKINTEFIGKGLIVDLKEIEEVLNEHTVILKNDCGELGNIAKHALQLYSNIVEANSLTNKFVQALSLIEYLSNPFEFEKMQKLKGPIISFTVDNSKDYHKLSDRFKWLTGLKNESNEQIGLRTNIVHNGQILEDLLAKPHEAELLIKEMQLYICNYMRELFINYKESWEFFENIRSQRYESIMKSSSGFEGKYYTDTLVLIDFKFFNDALREVYQMYPHHIEKKFNMPNFLISCMVQAGIERKGYKIPFQFVIESNQKIYNDSTSMNILDYEKLGMNSDYGEFDIHITQIDKDYHKEFESILEEYTLERNHVLFPSSRFDNIILLSDRNDIPQKFFENIEQSVKEVYLGRLDNNRTTAYPNFIWFDIQYLICIILEIDLTEDAYPNLIFDII
ncbi:hypothetical protein ACQKIC_18640 [Peribacillus sp. NPDC046944]|uniref:hypothetical protein n=1 Tax=unclassified Peribacillus TaxID=2675266 RepID=UPI003D02CC9D